MIFTLEQMVLQMVENIQTINHNFKLYDKRIEELENKVSKLEEQLKNK